MGIYYRSGDVGNMIAYSYYINRHKDVSMSSLYSMVIAILLYPFLRNKYKGFWLIVDRVLDVRDKGFYIFRYMKAMQLKDAIYYVMKVILKILLHFFWLFPVKNNRVSLINTLSYTYGDSLKYIYEYIQRTEGERYEIVFPLHENVGISGNAIMVKPMSLMFFYYIITSSVVITNGGGLAACLPKRNGQLFINTWHGGGAYKKVGIDIGNNSIRRLESQMEVINTDIFFSSSEAFSRYAASGRLYNQRQVLATGLPRNDIFFQTRPEIIERVYRALNLNPSDHFVLYAPTFRSDVKYSRSAQTIYPVDIDVPNVMKSLQKKISGNWRFCIRFHPGVKNIELPDDRIINCTDYPDMQELLYAASVIITDYSSVMWDASLTYKPCLIYGPDIDQYEKERGFYTPSSEWPFPIARTNEELIENILDFDESDYRAKIRHHHEVLGSYETGNACKITANLIEKHIVALS